MKKTIAITGGIGSGKSTVSKILKDKGYSVFSCDEIYGELLHGEKYKQKIASIFPTALKNGEIDKGILGKLIFENPKMRQTLNENTHPLIMSTLFENIQNIKEGLIFAEVPLLFEGKYAEKFDEIIVVYREKQERIEAIKGRNGLSEEEIVARILAQFDYDLALQNGTFEKTGTHVLYNDGSIEQLAKNTESLLKKI